MEHNFTIYFFWEKFPKTQLNVGAVAGNARRTLEPLLRYLDIGKLDEKIKNYDDCVLFYLLFIECIAGLHNAQCANICIEQRPKNNIG